MKMNTLEQVEELIEKGYNEQTAWQLVFENSGNHRAVVDEVEDTPFNHSEER